MPFRLLKYEGKKLLEQPMILIFFVCTLLLNTGVVVTSGLTADYLSLVTEVKSTHGEKVTRVFQDNLTAFKGHKSFERLQAESAEVTNVFAAYQATALRDEVVYMFDLEGSIAEKMTGKYIKLQPVIDQLAEAESALELAGAGETMAFFTFIRNRLLPLLLSEGLVFAILIGLYSSTSERLTKTDSLVFTSKTGRKLQGVKYLSSLGLVLVFYMLQLIGTVGLNEWVMPLGRLWQNSVASYFHLNVYIPNIFEVPFITWAPLTFQGYSLLTGGLSVLLITVIHGFSFILGMWLADFLRGLVLVISLVIVLKGALQLALSKGLWSLWSLLMWTPLAIVENQGHWFTEMALYATVPWQETVAVLGYFAMLLAAGLLTIKYYPKKEVS